MTNEQIEASVRPIFESFFKKLENLVDIVYAMAYADGVESRKVQTTEELDLAAEKEAENIQDENNIPPLTGAPDAEAVPSSPDSAPDAFDPLNYKHAVSGTPKTACGLPIDNRVDVASEENTALVTCPRCLENMKEK